MDRLGFYMWVCVPTVAFMIGRMSEAQYSTGLKQLVMAFVSACSSESSGSNDSITRAMSSRISKKLRFRAKFDPG